jgi:ubiquinone/menaquinone biosynthesis C-methylase UbiE
MTARFIAEQLAHPKGIRGWLVAFVMNRINAAMNSFTLKTIAVRRTEKVLEIGFGGGSLLEELLRSSAHVSGIDRSSDVVRRAQRRFQSEQSSGRAHFCQGDIEALPFNRAEFDVVLTVNTVYFWHSLQAGFSQIGRVLRPGGRLAVTFLVAARMAPMKMPTDIFTLRDTDEVVKVLEAEGFSDVKVLRPSPNSGWNTVLAIR